MSLSCWSPNKGIPWLWICHYEQCQGSRLLHQVSASVNPRRACHHSGEGKQSIWGNCLQTVLAFIANKYLWVKPVKPCYLSSTKFSIKFLWFIGMCLRFDQCALWACRPCIPLHYVCEEEQGWLCSAPWFSWSVVCQILLPWLTWQGTGTQAFWSQLPYPTFQST